MTTTKRLNMIWAMDKNWLIGDGLKIPWHIPEDFKFFKETTLGKTVIMGLKTYESLGKPLPGRRNIVLNFDYLDLPGCEIALSIEDAISKLKKNETAFVIGGASIYKQFLNKVERLYITHIEHEFSGNIYFPKFDLDEWKLVKKEKGLKNDKNPYDYWFCVYERR